MTVSGAEAPAGWIGRRALSETAAVNLALLVLGALTGIITARLLGPEGRGALALALAVAGIGAVVAGLGLQQALAYRVAAERERLAHALALALWTGLVVGGVVAALGWVVCGALIDEPASRDAVRIALLSIPVSAAGGNLSGVLQGMRAGRPFNLLRLTPPAAFAALLVAGVLADADLGPVDIVWMYLAACTLAAVASIAVLRRRLQHRRPPPWAFSREVLRYGLVVNIGALAWTANRQLALIVLAAVAGLADVGLYSVALGYSLPVGIVAVALALHTLPDMAATTDPDAQRGIARRRLRTALLTTLPLTVGGVLAAPLLVPLAFGDDFSGAVTAAQVLVLAQALLGLNQVLSEISRGLGRPGVPAVAEGAGAVATILALPLVVPPFGLVGAATATAVIYLATGTILGAWLQRRLSA